MTVDGYQYAREAFGRECGDLANERLAEYGQSGGWRGSFEELMCCLFFEQRRWRHFGYDPTGKDLLAIQELYSNLVKQWQMRGRDA